MAGVMCLVADLAVFVGSLATIFGISWYQDPKRKRKIRKPKEEEDKKEQQLLQKEEILNEQMA
jgi:uncharacterized membrane protein